MHFSGRSVVMQRIFLILFAIFVLNACANINHLREAQSTFNETAVLENKLTLNILDRAPDAMSSAEAETQIRAGYSSVLVSLSNAEEDDADVLKSNRLYGNMLMLRALAYWRLGDLDNAAKVAAIASALPDEQLFPRDKAMAIAMPGLIRNSQAFVILNQTLLDKTQIPAEELKALKTTSHQEVIDLIEAALQKYDDAAKTLAGNHGLLVYLYEAKFAAYKNLADAQDKFKSGKRLSSEIVTSIKTNRENFKKAMCAAADIKSGNTLPAEDFARLVSWDINLGLKSMENKC